MTIYALDWETQGLHPQKPILGCLIKEGKERYDQAHFFTRPQDMYNTILDYMSKDRKRGLKSYFYAHHHSYDMSVYMQGHIVEEKKEDRLHIFNPSTLYALWRKQAYLLDTLSYFPMDLNSAAQIIGMHKSPMHEKLTKDEPQDYDFTDMNEIKQYCYQDTLIVLKLVHTMKNTLSQLDRDWETRGIY